MSLEPQLSIEAVWKDEDMFETRVTACNERYFGITEVYNDFEDLLNFAKSLKKFPKSVDSELEYKAGDKMSYAFFSMRFYCVDSVGHTAVQVEIEENVGTEYRPEEKCKLSLEIRFEPSAIDSFQSELVALAKKGEGKAILKGEKA